MSHHFAFFMLPEPGHLRPSLRVAENLQQLGHFVSYLTTPELMAYLSERGFGTLPVFQSFLTAKDQRDLLLASPALLNYRRLTAFLAMSHLSFGGYLVRELRPLKFDALVCDGDVVDLCGLELLAELHKPVIALRVHFHRRKEPDSRIPELVLCPRELDISSTRSGQPPGSRDVEYVEPSVDGLHHTDSQPAKSSKDKRPIVYCSFGSQVIRYPNARSVMRAIVEGFRDLSHTLVVSSGNFTSVFQNLRPPPNVTLLRTANQLEYLQDAALFITHGGLGGLKETILCGVVPFVIPFDMDQPSNAMRVEHHAIGLACQADECTPEIVSKTVKALLESTSTRENLCSMNRIFWDYERRPRAARLIADYANGWS